MTKAFEELLPSVPFKVDIKIWDTLGRKHSIKGRSIIIETTLTAWVRWIEYKNFEWIH